MHWMPADRCGSRPVLPVSTNSRATPVHSGSLASWYAAFGADGAADTGLLSATGIEPRVASAVPGRWRYPPRLRPGTHVHTEGRRRHRWKNPEGKSDACHRPQGEVEARWRRSPGGPKSAVRCGPGE